MKALLAVLLLTATMFGQASPYKQIYDKLSIAEKKEVWHRLTKDERTEVRRAHFVRGIGYLNLNEVQIDFLLRFSKKLPDITREELDAFQAEAIELFPKEVGAQLFGVIGPYTCLDERFGNCPCSIGSSFNMSCSGTCDAPGGLCTTTTDGCGFAWLYPCDGKCGPKAYDEWKPGSRPK